jgi:hypothetical protein
MEIIGTDPTGKLELSDGFQLFTEPDRDWLTLSCRGTISPNHLAERALQFLTRALAATEDDDIVLTIDCVGVEWETHGEFTKEGLNESAEQQLQILYDTMPRRFDEYLSTSINVTDTATLFASATNRFSDEHAIISVPFHEAKSWIESGDFPSSRTDTREVITQLADALARRLGPVKQSIYAASTTSTLNQRSVTRRAAGDRFADQLFDMLTSQE